MSGIWLVSAGTALLCLLGIIEQLRHAQRLRTIPIRIHVNGTRGKSGVTRLIAAGLRAGGIRTCAKTTGTLPRMMFPDGSEYPVFRPSKANVIEQLRIVRAAAMARAEALVIECMALQPALQSLCELKLVRATHGVVTNVRADHLDVMGPEVTDVARSIAGTVPIHGKLFSTEKTHLPELRRAANDRHSEVINVSDREVADVSDDELDRFSYIEHPDNVALAVRVCQDLGVDRGTALRGMWDARPDPGVMTVYQTNDFGQSIVFINGFAANDPESTGKIWNLVVSRYGQGRRRIAIVNCRDDRPDRSRQIGDSCLEWSPADHYLVVGTATNVFAHRAKAMGMCDEAMTCAEGVTGARLLPILRRLSGASALVMGMGNISGPGMELVDHYRRQEIGRSQPQFAIRKAA